MQRSTTLKLDLRWPILVCLCSTKNAEKGKEHHSHHKNKKSDNRQNYGFLFTHQRAEVPPPAWRLWRDRHLHKEGTQERLGCARGRKAGRLHPAKRTRSQVLKAKCEIARECLELWEPKMQRKFASAHQISMGPARRSRERLGAGQESGESPPLRCVPGGRTQLPLRKKAKKREARPGLLSLRNRGLKGLGEGQKCCWPGHRERLTVGGGG